jgi:hypothetical protein
MKTYSVKQNKTAVLQGFKDGIPIGLGYFAVAFSLGIAAKNAGLKSIGVLWGFRDREIIEEKGAEYIVETVNDLEKLLISLKNG